MMFSAMLTDAFNEEEAGGIPFRFRWLESSSKVSKAYVRDMLFDDDCALAAQIHRVMQDHDNFHSLVTTLD